MNHQAAPAERPDLEKLVQSYEQAQDELELTNIQDPTITKGLAVYQTETALLRQMGDTDAVLVNGRLVTKERYEGAVRIFIHYD